MWLFEKLLARICFCWSKPPSCQKCLGGWGYWGRLGAKGYFHPHIHNPPPPSLPFTQYHIFWDVLGAASIPTSIIQHLPPLHSYPISYFFRIVSTLAPSLTSKVSAEEMFRKYEFLHNNSCQESVAEQYCNIFCKFCPPFSFWMSVALEKEAIELLTLAADKHRRIPTTADMCSFA